MLTQRDTRTRLTQREFVIATGHHSRSRTTASKYLILGPAREIRSRSVSSGEPFSSSGPLCGVVCGVAGNKFRIPSGHRIEALAKEIGHHPVVGPRRALVRARRQMVEVERITLDVVERRQPIEGDDLSLDADEAPALGH